MTSSHSDRNASRLSPALWATLTTLLLLVVLTPAAGYLWAGSVSGATATSWGTWWREALPAATTRPLDVVLTGLPLAFSLLVGLLVYRLRDAHQRLHAYRLKHAEHVSPASEKASRSRIDVPVNARADSEKPLSASSTTPAEPPGADAPTEARDPSPARPDKPASELPRFTDATKVGRPTTPNDSLAQEGKAAPGQEDSFDAPTRRDPTVADHTPSTMNTDPSPAPGADALPDTDKTNSSRFTAPTRKVDSPRFDESTRRAQSDSYNVIQRLSTLEDDTSPRGDTDPPTSSSSTTEDSNGD